MKVIVHYNLIDVTRKLVDSLQYTYSKPFDSLDAAYDWINTTNDPILNLNLEVTE